MAKTITLVIPDAYEGPLESWLSSQLINQAHPVTGAAMMVRIFPTVDDWAEHVLREALAPIARMYPTAEMVTKMDQQRQLQEEILEMSKPPSMKPDVVKAGRTPRA